MIVVIRKDTQEPAMRQLAVRLMNQGVRIGRTPGQDADVLTLVGDTWRLDPEGLLALPYVLDVRRITPPYRLAGRAAHPENTVVEVGSARIGAEFCLIAGPCAVESQVQMAGVARRVKVAGAQLLRGGVFKPRTSPYSFQGLGQAGIPLLVDAGQGAGLPVVTEITDPRQLDDLADVDVLQVGARNMQNFPLLQALGQVRKPVLLKRGMSATVTELLQAAEYILAGGNSQVILCERGIRTFETDSRATLDIAAIPVLKRLSHLPVIVDPSHAAGRAELVAPLALAAAAAGAAGAFAAAGVRILEDTAITLSCGVRIVGRKDHLYTNGSRFTAAQLMPTGPDDRYTVWLDHEPRDFKNAAAAGADLILSGHTHGGQVWPAGAVGMAAKNERNYGRKHITDRCDAIVSGGTGTWGYKFRTQGRTEIVCITITTKKETSQ